MIPDYKLYHGAVLAELVDEAKCTLSIAELREEGRLSSYVLNDRVGLYVKHSGTCMPPWQFTFTEGNSLTLRELQRQSATVFVVLVCWLDGMVCLSFDELAMILNSAGTQQEWVRVERRKNEWYGVSGSAAELPHKKPRGLAPLIEALSAAYAAT